MMKRLAVIFASIAIFSLSSLAAAQQQMRVDAATGKEIPVWANDFVDTIGINTHCAFANIGWTDCKYPEAARTAIETLGVRHLRDGFSAYWKGYGNSGGPQIPTYREGGASLPVTAFYNRLAHEKNVRFDFVVGLGYGNHAPYAADVKTAVPSTEALELGGNEPDSPYSPPDLCPPPNPGAISCWLRDSVAQIHYYSQYVSAAGFTRVGPSIEYGESYKCSNVPHSQKIVLSQAECPANGAPNVALFQVEPQYLDAINLHNYSGEKYPGNADLDDYKRTAQSHVPATAAWITETGYGTGKNGQTDLRISKFEPRIFAENFYKGVQRTYQFEMFDQPRDAAGPYFDSFGLLTFDASGTLTPKLQYEALRSLIALTNDPGQRPALSPLALTIAGGDENVHHILLQRQDGTYQLLLWIEGPDPAPPQRVNLTLCSAQFKVAKLSQFTPANGQYTNSSLASNSSSGGCTKYGPLNVTDALQIYRFGTKNFHVPNPPASARAFSNEH